MALKRKEMSELLHAKALEIFQYIKIVLGRYGQIVELPEPVTMFSEVQEGHEMRQMFRYHTEHLLTRGCLRALRVEIALSSSGKFKVELHFDLPDAPTQTFHLE